MSSYKYEDFTIVSCYTYKVLERVMKSCYITDGLYEFNVICGPDDDPIAVFIEANQ